MYGCSGSLASPCVLLVIATIGKYSVPSLTVHFLASNNSQDWHSYFMEQVRKAKFASFPIHSRTLLLPPFLFPYQKMAHKSESSYFITHIKERGRQKTVPLWDFKVLLSLPPQLFLCEL